jgi:plasmid stabilization system protein ParE
MFELKFSEKYNSDIVSSILYIKETLKAPRAAENHVEEAKKKYEQLKENPFRSSLVHDKYLATKVIRLIKAKNYMIFYSVNEKANEVFLYRFMYCRRDWINILTNELKD